MVYLNSFSMKSELHYEFIDVLMIWKTLKHPRKIDT